MNLGLSTLIILKQRGLNSTELIISNAHSGLISSIRKSFAGASWQRCQVHFIRNILSTTSKNDSKPFHEAMKIIYRCSDIELARIAKNNLLEAYVNKIANQKAYQKLDEGFEDVFQYTVVGADIVD